MQEVLTWCYSDIITDIGYGLIYNWYAASDTRNIASAGWHVPIYTEIETLISYLDPELDDDAGGHIKETGTIYWDDPNVGASNSVGFNGRGAGLRDYYSAGAFDYLTNYLAIHAADESAGWGYGYNLAVSHGVGTAGILGDKEMGYSIRLVKDSTSLTHGETGTYTGNDGKVYRTICIGTQEWLADNLAETKYRNGDDIPEVTDGAEWCLLATGALCAYNNDWNYV